MLSDITPRQGAIDRVGDRVHPHICIGVTLEPTIVQHLHTAEDHVISVTKAVHVVAVAQPYIHIHTHCTFGPGEILGPCDFQVIRIARNNRDFDSRSARDFYIIRCTSGMG